MSTRSAVMVQYEDKVKVIYVHSDGYPSGVGKVLYEHFNAQEVIDALIENGCRSFLCEIVANSLEKNETGYRLNEDRVKDQKIQQYYEIQQYYNLGYMNPESAYIPYDDPASEYDNYEEAVEAWFNDGVMEFCYYWDGTKWWVNNFELQEILNQLNEDSENENYIDFSYSKKYESWKSRSLPTPSL